MALITNSRNIVINTGSFNDAHGNFHSYNSIHATNVDSFNISNPVNVLSPQPQAYTGPHSPTPTDVSSASPSSSTGNDDNCAATGIDQNIQQFISHTVGGVSDAHEIEDASKIEEIDDAEDAEDALISHDDRSINRTYQFRNVQAVYINAFNTRGVRVKNAGNHAPQVIHHDETIVVRPSNDGPPTEGPSSKAPSSKSSQQMAALGQLSRCQDVPPDSTSGSPPVIPLLPFQDSQPAQSGPLSVPAIGIPTGSRSNDPFLNQFMVVPPPDIPLPTFEDSEGQASMSLRKSDKLPATTGTTMMPENDATSRHYAPKMPAPTTLPGPEFQPFQPFLVNPFLNMGLHPSLFLPHILPPLPGAAQNASPNNIMVNKWSDTFSQPNLPPHHHPESPTATDLSPDPPDTNSKRLEYYLDSALVTALIIQTSGISSSVDILSPRAYNTLKALNALVSVETPLFCPRTVASDPPTRFKSVRKATRWLRTWNPQAPKENIPK